MPNRPAVLRARALRHERPAAERILWTYLRGPMFKRWHLRRQAPIGPFFADFLSHRMKVIIEIDGDTHHPDRDLARDTWLAAKGFQTFRFHNFEVFENAEGVADRIHEILTALEATAPPQPSPEARRQSCPRGAINSPQDRSRPLPSGEG